MTAEEWRRIDVAPRYEVSDQGRVRSWVRPRGAPFVMTPYVSRGYHKVKLWDAGKRSDHFVHRLVAHAFIGPRPEGMMHTRHLDGDCRNNIPSNLAYGTPRENQLDALRHGTHHNANKTECPAGHAYTPENIRESVPIRGRHCRACERRYNDRKRLERAAERIAS